MDGSPYSNERSRIDHTLPIKTVVLKWDTNTGGNLDFGSKTSVPAHSLTPAASLPGLSITMNRTVTFERKHPVKLRGANKPFRPSHGDRRIQDKCPEDFDAYSKEIKSLADKFDRFMGAIRPIGSSSGLIYTSKALQKSMKDVSDVFRSNAANMWKFYSKTSVDDSLPDNLRPPEGLAPTFEALADAQKAVLSQLPVTLKTLSDHLGEFLNGLHEIPEFTDKRLTDALDEFRNWLVYRAEYLRVRQGAFRKKLAATLSCIDRIMREMLDNIRRVRNALQDFNGEGIKAIQGYQQRSQTKLQNMSTVATFFSAVTATTMQYAMDRKGLGTIVMCLWISSLILSIGSAINAQLAMHWRAAMYRSPRSALPLWTRVCLDHTPLLCLVGAVLAFSAGLVIWTFAAELAVAVKICAATMTSATSLILFTVIIWEVGEWWVQPTSIEVERISGHLESTKRAAEDAQTRISAGIGSGKIALERVVTGGATAFSRALSRENVGRSNDLESAPPTLNPRRPGSTDQPLASTPAPAPGPPGGVNEVVVSPQKQTLAPVTASVHFQNLGKSVEASGAPNPDLQRPELRLGFYQSLAIDHPPSHDIHFSPDGMWLAISTPTSLTILDVDKYGGEPYPKLPSLEFERFAWSPDSSHVVATVKHVLLIWSKGEGWKQHLHANDKEQIDAVTGLQAHATFFVVINRKPYIFVSGKFKETNLPHLPFRICDIARIPSLEEASPKYATNYGLVVVLGIIDEDAAPEKVDGSIFTKINTSRPNSATKEHWLTVINVDNNEFVAESSIPADASHVCVSRDGNFVLVSYDGKHYPELWQLRDDKQFKLELCRDYAPPGSPSERRAAEQRMPRRGMSGRACFWGKSDEWVIATDGLSKIYIWDRDNGHLLNTLEGPSISFVTIKNITDSGTSLAAVSTNTEGRVLIWTAQEASTKELSPHASTLPST